MNRIVCLTIFTVLFSIIAESETATQTDWSGGGGEYYTYADWGDRFYESSAIDYCSDPGISQLGYDHPEHVVSGPLYDVLTSDIESDGDVDVLGPGAD